MISIYTHTHARESFGFLSCNSVHIVASIFAVINRREHSLEDQQTNKPFVVLFLKQCVRDFLFRFFLFSLFQTIVVVINLPVLEFQLQ